MAASVHAAQLQRIEPIYLDNHRDFDRAAIYRSLREIESCGATSSDALLLQPDAPLGCMPLADLIAWLHDNRLGQLADRVERKVVPEGQVVAVVLGDEGARIRLFDVPPPPAPMPCAVFRVRAALPQPEKEIDHA